MSIVTRFAPSPTGLLHLGHAYAASIAWRKARQAGGRFLLRIEDIDTGRCRPQFRQAILDDLAWLGLTWDGAVRTQSEHLPEYRAVLDRLAAEGLLYPCFGTRADIARAADAPQGPGGVSIYPGTCRPMDPARRAALIAAGTPYALRLDMAQALARTGKLSFLDADAGEIACHPARFGDVVLGRKDAPASYHLCVTHDDAAQGVTLVTRGLDLLPATDIHRVLQALLGWPVPGYAHHPLLRGADGQRLAKREGAPSIASLREAGLTPAQVIDRTRAAGRLAASSR